MLLGFDHRRRPALVLRERGLQRVDPVDLLEQIQPACFEGVERGQILLADHSVGRIPTSCVDTGSSVDGVTGP